MSADRRWVSLRPAGLLAPLALHTVFVDGVSFENGAAVPLATSLFTTSSTTFFASTNWSTDLLWLSPVPINASLLIRFDEEFDPTTVLESGIQLINFVSGQTVAGTVTVSADRKSVLFRPGALLAVGTEHRLHVAGIENFIGTAVGTGFRSFVTGFTTDTQPPTLRRADPGNGATGVGLFDELLFEMTEPIVNFGVVQVERLPAETEITGFVDVVWDKPEFLRFDANEPFGPDSDYRVTLHGARDSAGNQMAEAIQLVFRTVSGIAGPLNIVASNPGSVSGVPTNATIEMLFDKTIDPAALIGGVFTLEHHSQILSLPIEVTQGGKGIRAVQHSALEPNTRYQVVLPSRIRSTTGESAPSVIRMGFETGALADTQSPSIVAVNPPPGAANVHLVPALMLQVDELPNRATVNPATVTLTSSTGMQMPLRFVSFAADQRTATFNAERPLGPSTQYALRIDGVEDQAGNRAPPVVSQFHTAAAGYGVAPQILSMQPVPGSSNIGLNPVIVITLNQPMNPISLAGAAVVDEELDLPLGVDAALDSSGKIVTLRPRFTLQPLRGYYVRLDIRSQGGVAPMDVEGAGRRFTTGTGPSDAIGPRVISITPANGSQDVNPANPLAISFSEPVNPDTVNFDTVGVWIDKERTSFGPLLFRSPDNTTFTFSGITTFSPGTEAVVWISDLVADLAGNAAVPAAAQFTFRDTTFDSSSPELVSTRPANGSSSVAAGSPVTFFFSEPLRAETIEPNIRLAENGVLAPGNVQLGSGADYAVNKPLRPFAPGSLAQGFADRGIRDIKGNFLFAGLQSTAFRIDASTAGSSPRVVDVFPSCCDPVAGNAIAGARFSKPLQQSSVNKATVIVNDLTAGRPLTAQVRVDEARQVIWVEPPNSWPAGARVQVIFTGSIRGQDGGPLESAATIEFQAGETLDRERPSVTAISPFDKAANVPVNALARIRFSEPVHPLSVNEATVKLSRRQGADVPYYLQFSESGRLVTLTPQWALAEGAEFSLAVNGVTDSAGNAVTRAAASFRTGRHVDAKRPEREYEQFYGDRPTNAGISILFTEPVDPTSVNPENIRIWKRNPVWLPDPILGSVAISADGRFATFRPVNPLPVYSQFDFEFGAIADLAGNILSSSSLGISTTGAVDSSPPTIKPLYPIDGQAGVPLDAEIRFELNEFPDETSFGAQPVAVVAGGKRVAGELLADTFDPPVVRFRPFDLLQPGTRYSVELSGFKDLAGNEQKGAVRYRFTTGPAPVFDTSLDSLFPRPGSHGVPWDIQPHFHSKIPIDPATLSTAKVILQRGHQAGPPIGPPTPVRLLLDNGDTRLRIIAESLLAPLQYYRITLTGELFDVLGHQLQLSEWWEFRTSADYPDNDPPVVTRMTPPNGAVSVPINARMALVLSEIINPDTFTPSSVTVSTSAGAPVKLSPELFNNGSPAMIWLNREGALQTSTTYTLSVNGLADFSGNKMVPFSWSFQTAALATPDPMPPSLMSIEPPLGSTGLPIRPVITLTYSEPIDPANVFQQYGSFSLIGSLAKMRFDVIGNVLRIVLDEDLIPNQSYTFATPVVFDLAGNVTHWNNPITGTYTIGDSPYPDTKRPFVTNFSPSRGSIVPASASPVISFNEPLHPLTLTRENVAILVDDQGVGFGASWSRDGTVVTLSLHIGDPHGKEVRIFFNDGVTDYAGNKLEPFHLSYRVADAPLTGSQSVFYAIRPEVGATQVEPGNPISLFFSKPMDTATATAGVQIAVNGVLVPVTLSYSAGNRVIEARPRNPFPSGALVETFVGPELVDESGFPVFPSRSAFYFFVTAGANEQPTRITGLWPNEFSNPVTSEFTVAFNNPIDPATVSSETVKLRRGTATIDGTLAVAPGGRIITFRPAAALAPNQRVSLLISKNLRDSNGTAFLNFDQFFGFNIGSQFDTSPPLASRLTPPAGSPGVGVNASIQIDFDEVINTAWLNESSVTVESGAGVLSAYSLRLDARSLMITPNSSLRENSVYNVSVSGVRDNSGNVSGRVEFQFTTGAGVDFAAPRAAEVFPTGVGVPRSAAIRVTFTEPVFPPSVNAQTIWVENQANGQSVPGVVTLDGQGRTAIFNPIQPFDANTPHHLIVEFGIVDLSGINYAGHDRYLFTTTSALDTQPPVIRVAPIDGAQNVARNARIAVWADSALTPESFEPERFELRNSQGEVVPVSLMVGADRSSVVLRPTLVLDANTVYSVRAGGMTDISGNMQPQPTQASFKTGSGFDLQGPEVLSTDPPDSGSDVMLTPELRVTFSEPVVPDSSAFSLDFPETPIAVRFDASATTAIVTPLTALDPSQSYRLSFPVRDLAGHSLLSTPSIWFSTAP